MNKKWVSVLLWVLAFLLSVSIAVYQRLTGPTHPVRGQETINGKTISYKLLRSYTAFEKLPVEIEVPDETVKAWLNHRRHNTDDDWTEIEMKRDGKFLKADIPGQPAAGKIEYMIRIQVDGESKLINNGHRDRKSVV